jgi:hypothetical protein
MFKKLGLGCLGLVAVVVVVIIVVAVATTSGGGGGGSSDTAGKPTDSSGGGSKAKPKASKPTLNADPGVGNRVKEGTAFTLGDFKIHKGWKVHKLGFGMGWEVKNLNVENVTDGDHAFDGEIKLHKGAHRIVAGIQCIADEAHPGDIVTADCLPDGSGKPYDYITIENTF